MSLLRNQCIQLWKEDDGEAAAKLHAHNFPSKSEIVKHASLVKQLLVVTAFQNRKIKPMFFPVYH